MADNSVDFVGLNKVACMYWIKCFTGMFSFVMKFNLFLFDVMGDICVGLFGMGKSHNPLSKFLYPCRILVKILKICR